MRQGGQKWLYTAILTLVTDSECMMEDYKLWDAQLTAATVLKAPDKLCRYVNKILMAKRTLLGLSYCRYIMSTHASHMFNHAQQYSLYMRVHYSP